MEGNVQKIRNAESDEKLERNIVAHYMKRCIVCYKPKSDRRAYAAERLQALLEFHCKYHKVGEYSVENSVTRVTQETQDLRHVRSVKVCSHYLYSCSLVVLAWFVSRRTSVARGTAHQSGCEYSKFVCPLGFAKRRWCDRLSIVQSQYSMDLTNVHLLPERFRRHPS
nr:unnamed protein product [Callosobruchus analis]